METAAQIPSNWTRAMERAARDRLHAEKINGSMYAVRSVSHPGTKHLVKLQSARIIECTDCPGWRGRSQPCKHAGAVARRLLRETRQPERRTVSVEAPAIESRSTKRQIFRAA